MEPVWALGFMSGTSLDGIDAALILSNGRQILAQGPTCFMPYESAFRQEIRQCLGKIEWDSHLRRVEEKLTRLHAEVANRMMAELPTKPHLIGFHGQTIFHAPPKTWQIGNAVLLSELTGVPVIYDFRVNDCLNGGQGAPLVPVYHQALAKDLAKPLAFLNIGGVSNITYVDETDTLIAFDIGPGNALIDDYVFNVYGIPYDEGGAIAVSGTADQHLIKTWLKDPFFTIPYPKSLDRDHFATITKEVKKLPPADAVATLTLFSAVAIALACKQLPRMPRQLIVCGGGAKNQTLRQFLTESLMDVKIVTTEEVLGWSSDFIEAQAFAFLAIRSFYGLPLSFPLTTGVKIPLTGGKMTKSNLMQGGKIG